MDIDSARRWLILASLTITAVQFVFFLIAPVTGYPLEFTHSIRLIEIILPVFLGYLGSAARFVFPQGPQAHEPVRAQGPLVGLLVRGPVIVFSLVGVVAIIAFGYSNRIDAPMDSGMNVDQLAGIISLALGLLAVTTGVAVSYLFPTAGNHGSAPGEPSTS
jgi:hypothetical protein